MKKRAFAFVIATALFGCVPAPKTPLPPPVPTPPPVAPLPPTFEKTFGEASIGKTATLIIHFKSITLLIDPDLDSGAAGALSNQTDYLLLTDASPQHFSTGAQSGLRKDMKIVSSPEEATKVAGLGFNEVKVLSAGQRVLLKKNNDFVFVSAAQSRSPLTGAQVDSYLLEFDNGVNLLIAGETTDANGLRELVYGLRDDGKQVATGFFAAVSGQEPATAQLISLIQPKNAVLVGPSRVDEPALRAALKNELFEGALVVMGEGSVVSF